MNSEYYLLPLALILLWLPAAIISPATVREKLRQQVRRHDDGFLSLFRNWVNWVDLCRSAAGVWMLQRMIAVFSVGQDDLVMTIMGVQFAILFIGVLAQILWFSQKRLIIGPTFYLIGLTLVLSGLKVGFFALALGLVSALMLRKLSLSFFFVPVSLVLFSFLFGRIGLPAVFNAAAFALPGLLSFTLGERIAFARRPKDSKQVGYVYGGVGIPDADDMPVVHTFPAKEDVPDRIFNHLDRRTGPKSNDALKAVAALPHKTS